MWWSHLQLTRGETGNVAISVQARDVCLRRHILSTESTHTGLPPALLIRNPTLVSRLQHALATDG